MDDIQLTVFHLQGSVGDVGQGHVVCNDDQSLVKIVAHFLKVIVDQRRVLGVEVACRLIGENDFWLIELGSGDGDTLLFTAGQLTGFMVDAMGQTKVIEELFATFFCGVHRDSGDQSGHYGIFEGGKFWE
jgi:hypothetical protein